MKKVLLLATGGTTASGSSEGGLVPSPIDEEILHYLGEYHGDIGITCENLLRLDSSNVQPEKWQLIARHIAKAKSRYDDIVPSHDIDTMVYTAGTLSLMLHNLDILLIMAGSQLPLLRPLSDSVENICMAFAAAYEDIQGMYVCPGRRIILAIRVVKVRTMNFGAFKSINIGPCGRVDAKGPHINRQLLIHPTSAFTLRDELCKEVVLIKLTLGTNPLLFDELTEMGIHGTAIETFGVGGINFVRHDLISKLEEITTHGVSMVVYSQCLYEYSDFSICQTGRKVLQRGVIQGCDMVNEACAIKLMWALGRNTGIKEIKWILETNYVSEITLPQAYMLFCLGVHVEQKLLSIGGPQLVEDFYFLVSGRQHESRSRPFILLLSA